MYNRHTANRSFTPASTLL
uniref:Uncharacterized protein n=1 Tax=Anguilla anguilla TaxID=7936 RepID=A0A0E9TDR3_ANGAN